MKDILWKKMVLLLFTSHVSSFSVLPPPPQQQKQQRRQLSTRKKSIRLFGKSSSNDSSSFSSDDRPNGKGRKNSNSSSASSLERRNEEKRRKQRQDDVVIGKTSALRDATDYRLNPQATEEEYLRQASRDDQKVFRFTDEGMNNLKMLQLQEASDAFDKVYKIKPNAYLWQAGIAKFYLDEYETAANLFAKNAAVYESKFGGQASEERIWRHACELKIAYTNSTKKTHKVDRALLEKIQSNLLPMKEIKGGPDSLFAETRKVIRIAGDLFDASVNDDVSGVIIARAKLRSLGGDFDDLPRLDIKMWKLNAWFYLGLHYDALGQVQESKECMKMALFRCPSAGKSDDIIHTLPLIHMTQRDWFDDDEFGADPLEILRPSPVPEGDEKNTDNTIHNGKDKVHADPLVSDSIRKSIEKMTLLELENALKVNGIKAHGPKNELQNRLFRSLMSDAGFAP